MVDEGEGQIINHESNNSLSKITSPPGEQNCFKKQ